MTYSRTGCALVCSIGSLTSTFSPPLQTRSVYQQTSVGPTYTGDSNLIVVSSVILLQYRLQKLITDDHKGRVINILVHGCLLSGLLLSTFPT